MAPPLTERASQFRSQLNFMSMFALPLFQGVADLFPNMQYTVGELQANFDLFQHKVAQALSSKVPSEENNATKTVTVYDESDLISRSASTPELRGGFRSSNDSTSNFEPVKEAASGAESHTRREEERSRELTTDSSCAHVKGDCASGATAGKMPLSPSTQGTSVVRQESTERPRCHSIPTISAPDSAKSMTEPKLNGQPIFEVENASSLTLGNDRSIKKRPSRFRMNAFQFFWKHKSSGPSSRASESP